MKIWRRKHLMFVVLGISAFVGLVILVLPKFLVVKNIECYTQYGSCPTHYYERVELVRQRPLYWPLPRQELTSAFANDSQVRSVYFYRRLPSTVVVSVNLRKPIGVVGSQVLGIVDEQGTVFGEVKETTLPQLIFNQTLVVGDKLPDNYIKALEILNRVSTIVGKKGIGEVSGEILTVNLPNNIQVVVGLNQDIDTWSPALQSIFTRSKIDGKQVHKIDLRFSNPVVIY